MKKILLSLFLVLCLFSTARADYLMGGGGGGSISTYADVVAVFGSGACSGYLKSNGTCDTPAAAFDPTQPGPIGGTTPAEGSFTKISTGTSDKSWLPMNAIVSMDYVSPGSGMGAFFFGGVAHYIFFDAVEFLFTDPIGNTSTRIPKGWFTDLEITNLPTVNGKTVMGGDVQNVTETSEAATCNWSNGNTCVITAEANTTSWTLTMSNPVSGQVYRVYVTQQTGGPVPLPTFSPTVTWVGTAPTFSGTNTKHDAFTCQYVGTTYFCGNIGNNF